MDRKISVRCIIYCLLGIGGQSLISSGLEAVTKGKITKGKFKVVALYHIAKFVNWPEAVFTGEKTPIVFTILGQDAFGNSLEEELCGKFIQNRQIVIRRAKTIDALNPDSCHVLFICKSEKSNLAEIIARVRKRAILTISDIAGFSAYGGIVGLTPRKMPKFEVNMESLSLSGLSMGSPLLSLARIKHEILPEHIFDIARHSIWPAPDSTDRDTTFKVMILGNSPFGKMMEFVSQDNTLNDKKIDVLRARYLNELSEENFADVQILFSAQTDQTEEMKLFQIIGNRSILTISKSSNFAASGGMVEIDLYNKEFPFSINRGAAARVGIRFKAELLKFARNVETSALLEND